MPLAQHDKLKHDLEHINLVAEANSLQALLTKLETGLIEGSDDPVAGVSHAAALSAKDGFSTGSESPGGGGGARARSSEDAASGAHLRPHAYRIPEYANSGATGETTHRHSSLYRINTYSQSLFSATAAELEDANEEDEANSNRFSSPRLDSYSGPIDVFAGGSKPNAPPPLSHFPVFDEYMSAEMTGMLKATVPLLPALVKCTKHLHTLFVCVALLAHTGTLVSQVQRKVEPILATGETEDVALRVILGAHAPASIRGLVQSVKREQARIMCAVAVDVLRCVAKSLASTGLLRSVEIDFWGAWMACFCCIKECYLEKGVAKQREHAINALGGSAALIADRLSFPMQQKLVDAQKELGRLYGSIEDASTPHAHLPQKPNRRNSYIFADAAETQKRDGEDAGETANAGE